jgi:Zn-dependent protease with chaperone function
MLLGSSTSVRPGGLDLVKREQSHGAAGAPATTVDFFAAQDLAVRRTRRLLPLILVCAAVVIVLADLWLGLVIGLHVAHGMTQEAREAYGVGPFLLLLLVVPLEVYAVISAILLAIIVTAILRREWQLRRGSAAFARSLGAVPVTRDQPGQRERLLLNVADEMALAAQLPPPTLYVLDEEQAVNSLAFASTAEDSAVILTRGAVEQLSRAELQVLIGSALARLRNGDVALNVRAMGWLAGLTAIGQVGTWLMRMPARVGRLTSPKGGKMNDLQSAALFFSLIFVPIGAVIAVIGLAGNSFARSIRVLGSRQRVLLADASVFQFTRDPAAVSALLHRLERGGRQRLRGDYGEEVGPLLFVPGTGWRCLPTHPSISDRARALQLQLTEPGTRM